MRHEPDGQFKWICHMKDYWSKLTKLMPATSKTADEIVGYISEWIYAYGPPEMLQSDNGSEFKGAIEYLLKAHGIKKVKHGRPRTPQVHGLVEQANDVVQSRLAKWKTETGSSKWVNSLPIIQMGINNTKHSAILKTPYEVVFGRKMVKSALVPELVDWTTVEELNGQIDSTSVEDTNAGDTDTDTDTNSITSSSSLTISKPIDTSNDNDIDTTSTLSRSSTSSAASSILSLNQALEEDTSVIANFETIDISTLPTRLREQVEIHKAKASIEATRSQIQHQVAVRSTVVREKMASC